MVKTEIYFNAEKHVYTNVAGIPYISATTIIGKYEEKFDEKKFQIARACLKIANNPRHPNHIKYAKYRYGKVSNILSDWDKAREDGCERGNKEHDYLETSVKDSTGFYSVFKSKYDLSNDRVKLYTVEDVIDKPDSGYMDLGYFIECGVKDKYPAIYNIIESFVNAGWRIYSEVAVFNNQFMVSGLIDIMFVKGKSFVVLDWKTNRAEIRFEAGYWEKDANNNLINYKTNDKTFKYPMHKLPYSVGNKYTLQLSLYNWMAIQYGFNLTSNILAHIKHDPYNMLHPDIIKNPSWTGKTQVDILPISYLENEIYSMLLDYEGNRTGFQQSIF